MLGGLLCSSLGCRAEPEALRVGRGPWSEFEQAFAHEIGVVGEAEQARYLAQAGLLPETLRRCDQVLHAVRSVVGDTRYERAVSTEFLPGVSTP